MRIITRTIDSVCIYNVGQAESRKECSHAHIAGAATAGSHRLRNGHGPSCVMCRRLAEPKATAQQNADYKMAAQRLGQQNILTAIFLFLVAAKPSNSSRGELSFFFLLSFYQSSKEGQNSPNKHGSICNLGHKFQI